MAFNPMPEGKDIRFLDMKYEIDIRLKEIWEEIEELAGMIGQGTIGLDDLEDVDTTGKQNDNALTYNSSQQKWVASDIKKITINEKTQNYTLQAGDDGSLIDMNSSSGVTLTVPANLTVGFVIGTVIAVRQKGSGQVTIEGASGVTLQGYITNFKTAGQYAMAVLIKVDTNTWTVEGNLEAST